MNREKILNAFIAYLVARGYTFEAENVHLFDSSLVAIVNEEPRLAHFSQIYRTEQTGVYSVHLAFTHLDTPEITGGLFVI